MKNIFIEDYNLNLFLKLVTVPDIKIVGVHVKFLEEKKRIESQYPDVPVYLTEDITNWKKSFVSKEDIQLNYKSQVTVEHCFNRYRDNVAAEKQAYYFSSLAFWIYLLENNSLDCILIGQIDHGSPADTVLIDLAVYYHIPIYVFEIMLYNDHDCSLYYAIKNYNSGKYLNLYKLGLNSNTIGKSISDYVSSILGGNKSEIVKNYNAIKSSDIVKMSDVYVRMSYVNPLILQLGTYFINICILFPRLFSRATNRNYNSIVATKHLLRKIKPVCIYLRNWCFFLIGKKHLIEIQGDVVYQSYKRYISGWRYIKKLQKYYTKLSKKEIPDGEKYILYALHLEPEASFMARATYNSQLYNIAMLAYSLPKGWKLYVKEHPVQLDPIGGDFYTGYVRNFRSKEYYNYITQLPNTYLLDYHVPSSDILSKDSKITKPMAVSTINGTIILEAILHNIPALIFGKEDISYDSQLIFDLQDSGSIRKALNMLRMNDLSNANNIQYLIETLNETLFICTLDNQFNLSSDFLKKIIDECPMF